jgi:hypothetical protein
MVGREPRVEVENGTELISSGEKQNGKKIEIRIVYLEHWNRKFTA